MAIAQVRDYLTNRVTLAGKSPEPLAGPTGDLVILDTAEPGNYVACRPSGTEPKIKFYMFAYTPPEQLANLDTAKADCQSRLEAMEASLRAFAGV
jgi:phosphoglucomutase/phosphomannomutase